MKIGIIGGTFNPIHFAHLRIAEEVRECFGLKRVIFVPSSTPPHKPLADDLPFAKRFDMVRLATADNAAFAVSSIEGDRGGTSYSIDTLLSLRKTNPDDEFFFIIGSDSFLDIGSWHKYADIFSCCNIVVAKRPGALVAELNTALPIAIANDFHYYPAEKRLAHNSGYSVYYMEGMPLDISSTAIRDLVQLDHSIRYLAPSAVEHYIKEQRLYTNAC